jgi:hypothetical protein
MFSFVKIALVSVLTLASVAVNAQGFNPTGKVIEIVVPYPPGGATDKWGRVLDEIFKAQGWQSAVLNKPGADTVIGSNYVAAAKPDGHTIYVGGNGFLDANIAFKQKAPGIEYTENSFEPILPLGAGTAVLVVGKNVPVNTYEEFKQYVKKNPEKFNEPTRDLYARNTARFGGDDGQPGAKGERKSTGPTVDRSGKSVTGFATGVSKPEGVPKVEKMPITRFGGGGGRGGFCRGTRATCLGPECSRRICPGDSLRRRCHAE